MAGGRGGRNIADRLRPAFLSVEAAGTLQPRNLYLRRHRHLLLGAIDRNRGSPLARLERRQIDSQRGQAAFQRT